MVNCLSERRERKEVSRGEDLYWDVANCKVGWGRFRGSGIEYDLGLTLPLSREGMTWMEGK